MQTKWQRQHGVAFGAALLLSAAWLGFGCSSASSSDNDGGAGTAASNAGASMAGASGAGASGSPAGAGGAAAGSEAGESSGGSSGASAVTAACAAFAATDCAHYHDCLGLYFSEIYASVADCQTIIAKYCPFEIAAPGSSRTAEQLTACAQATAPQTCEEWLSTSPAVCFTPGSEPNGASCEYARQCVSTYCQTTADSWCGKCAPRGVAGEPCVPNDASCAVGLSCVFSCPGDATSCSPPEHVYKCASPVAEHEACVNDSRCAPGLHCSAGVCSAGKALGQPCDVNAEDCGYDSYCVMSGASSTCVKPSFVPATTACAVATATFCDSTSTCVDASAMRGNQGTCKASAAPGESCATVNCLTPARCLNNLCVLPQDAATCP
jgi:hypothetical protein